MSRQAIRTLPAHYIPRPRLVASTTGQRVVVVEAGAGYGKSTLAVELVQAWGAVEVEVAFHDGGGDAGWFATQLRYGILKAGFSGAAAAMAGGGEDPRQAVDAALVALDEGSIAFVLDDAHHAGREAAGLIDWMAHRLQHGQRLVVLARRLPDGALRLRRGEFLHLQAADVALQTAETLELCRSGFNLETDAEAAAALHAATGGWTAATVLAAARAVRTGETVEDVARAAGRAHGQSSIVAILDEAISAFEPAELTALAQVARLVPTDKATIDMVGGAGFFDRALQVGTPLAPDGDGLWGLPGPVSDHLATLAPPDPAVLGAVAESYARRGDLAQAVELLLALGLADPAASVLASAPPAALDGLDLLAYESFVHRLDGASLDRYPQVLLHMARVYDGAALFTKRTAVLDRLDVLAERAGQDGLRDALSVERTADLMRSSQYELVAARAERYLAHDDGADVVTRARALSVLARAMCWRTDAEGRRDEAAMRRSSDYFARAAELYRSVGLISAAASMVPYRAMWVDYALGNARAALAALDDGLALVVGRPRRWAFLLSFRGEVLGELGRYEEAEDAAREVMAVGERLGDDELKAYSYWNQAIIASHLGDAPRVLECVRRVEQLPGEWFEPTSGDFLGDAADLLDRVGETGLAWEYLTRALADPKDGGPVIAMAEAALLARHGDPNRAEECLSAVFTHRVDPRERWRVTLLRAYAAFRRGERSAGGLAARAMEEAARIGLDQLPLTKEREVTEAILGLAVETGQSAALALERASLPLALNVLGRFSLTRGGRPVALSAGQSTQLLKLLSVSGGRLPTEAVIETLWPEVEPDKGRHRLRTMLNRLRTEAGDVVVREGEALVLGTEVRLDLAEFENEARRARSLGRDEPTLAVAIARSAISRYRGDVLPEDAYEPWADRPRDHARRTALELLDLCTDVATESGDLDEVCRVVSLAIDFAPYEDHRYLRAATALLEQGRRGAALAVVARARAALAELGLPPPLDLVRIERMGAV